MKFLKNLFSILIEILLNLYIRFERIFVFSSLSMETFVFSSVARERYMAIPFCFFGSSLISL